MEPLIYNRSSRLIDIKHYSINTPPPTHQYIRFNIDEKISNINAPQPVSHLLNTPAS